MKSAILTVVALGLLLGADTPGDDKTAAEVKQALAALNEAFEKGEVKTVRAMMTADHVAVTSYYGGPLPRDEQLARHDEMKLTAYTPGTIRVTMHGGDAALVTYPLTMAGTFKGRPVPRKSFASAVWVKRDGRWLESYYQETPLDGD